MLNRNIKPYRLSIKEVSYFQKIMTIFFNSGYSFQRWPEIYIGNFDDFNDKVEQKHKNLDRDYNIFDMDYLGLYVYEIKKEGHIRIFKDRIRKCSIRLADELNYHRADVENDLITIVLIHEVGHWLTHSCHSKNREIRIEGFSKLNDFIVESMAQLTVVWSMMKFKSEEINRLKVVFNLLVDKQSLEYKVFRQLSNKQTHAKLLLKRYGYISEDHEYNYGYDFDYLLNGDKKFNKVIVS